MKVPALVLSLLLSSSLWGLPIGLLSYDVLVGGSPGIPGTNAFNIANFTGTQALPPDFPVISDVRLLNATLTILTETTQQVIPLGNLDPGSFSDPSLQFADDLLLTAAIFEATLDSTALMLDGGIPFAASSATVQASLLPGFGSYLTAGADFVLIEVNEVAVIPEPGPGLLILSAVGAMLLCRRAS